VSKVCLFSRTGGWCRCCSRRRMRVNPRRLPRGGFSRVELAAHMWTPRRVGGLETTSIEGCGWAFLVLEAAAVFVCVLEKTQSGYVTEPHGLTASLPSIGFCSAKAGSSREPLGARAQQAPPRQPNPASTRLRYYLLAASRRLVRGRQSWGNGAGFCSGLAALAVVLLLGLLVAASGDAKIERLRAVYKTSATPSSGLVETPSGGCGKDGFFLRLSLQKQLCGGTPFLRRRGESSRILWMGLLRVAGGVIGAAPEHRYMQRSLAFSISGIWICSTLKKILTTSTPPSGVQPYLHMA